MTRAANRPPARPAPREVPVHRTATRGGTALVVGVIEAADLRRTFTIPRRDARTKTGYQRELSQSRVNRLVKDLRGNRVDLPTSILVNLRDYDPEHLLVGHGPGVHGAGAKPALEHAYRRSRIDLPKTLLTLPFRMR